MNYVLGYLISCVGGMLILGVLVPIMHRTSVKVVDAVAQVGKDRPFVRWLDVWVGFTERAIATTLFIWAPAQLPLFIGGWIAAKIAGAWGRITDQSYAPAHLVALVGNALSFAIAIVGGMVAHPASLAFFQAGH